MTRMATFLVCLLFVVSPVFAAQDEIAAIEKKCIANRLAIKNYHIRVDVEREFFDEADKSNVRCTGLQFYYDDQNRRCDTTYEWYNHKLKPNTGRYVQMVVWNEADKFRYFWFDGIEEEGRQSAFQAYSIDNQTDKERAMMEFPDFRILGFSSSGFLLQIPFDNVVSSPARKNINMEDAVLNGMDCKKINCEHIHSESKLCYWIVPEKGCSIVRFEVETRDGAIRAWTELDVERDVASGLWFPVSSLMEEYHSGKLVTSEKLKIDVISLNKKIDPAYFTPKTMNIRTGAAVIMPPISNEQSFFWDGEKIVDASGIEYPHPLNINNISDKRWRSHLIVFAANLAVIGLFLLWLYFRRSK